MTATSALLRHTSQPPAGVMARALQDDAAELAAAWSRGDALSMVSAETVAKYKAPGLLLIAAASALRRVDAPMAALIDAYLTGRAAEMQFAFRDHQTAADLEEGADGIERLADEIVTRFRAGAEELVA